MKKVRSRKRILIVLQNIKKVQGTAYQNLPGDILINNVRKVEGKEKSLLSPYFKAKDNRDSWEARKQKSPILI
jgi:hypothetical protein